MLRALIVAFALVGSAPAAAQSGAASICPDDFGAFAGAEGPLACACSAQAADAGSVFGADVYTSDSSICKAAVHAGVIGAAGGAITVIPAQALRLIRGSPAMGWRRTISDRPRRASGSRARAPLRSRPP